MIYKIHRQCPNIINTIIFIVLSLLYLHISVCISKNITAFDIKNLISFIQMNKLLLLLVFITSVVVFFVKKISIILLAVTLITISIKISILLFPDFNRLVLLMLIGQIFFSIFFVFLLKHELSRAAYNSLIDKNALDFLPLKLIFIKINYQEKKKDMCSSGILTNWDQNSLFAIFEKRPEIDKNSNINLRITVGDKTFTERAKIVSSNEKINGIGFVLQDQLDRFAEKDFATPALNWNKLHSILSDMAYLPQFWK